MMTVDTGVRRWEHRRARSVGEAAATSYYGVPPIHKAHWRWSVALYFFLGGLAGASGVIASFARLFGGREARPLVRLARYLSFIAILPAPFLLIYDLGRPERFHHMLRVVKFRSPMSLGVWGLIAASATATLNAFRQAADDGMLGQRTPLAALGGRLPDRAIAALGVGPSFFLSGYTGVLLGATAVPLWAKNALLLGPLFLCSALSNACATLSVLLRRFGPASLPLIHRLERLERVALVSELILLVALEQQSGPVIARPLRTGRLGRIRNALLSAGLAFPISVHLLVGQRRGRLPEALRHIATLFVLASGFALRSLILFAGHASADDPEATFVFNRRGSRS